MRCPDRLVLLLLVLLCLAISCGTEHRRTNIVLIGVDTLRRDHVGCYGYRRPTTPNIDRLASEGVLFENAVSQSPWTLPSFATVLTSLYPTQHGAGLVRSGTAHFGTSMRTSFPPLAMILLKAGYTTGAIINGPALSPEYGVDRGFESYNGVRNWQARPADCVTQDALMWVDEHEHRPFFLFVHYFDCHVPYEPPAPYDKMFDPGYKGRVASGFDRDTYAQACRALSRSDDPQADADWNHLKALYDGEIAFTDQAVGRLLEGLGERGLRENTLIVFLSDHGEEFFDHGGFEHGHTLFDELIKVPLVFSLPGTVPANVRVGAQVRLLDVLPTILDLIDVKPETHFEGVSLKRTMSKGEAAGESETDLLSPRFAYSEAVLYGTEKKSIAAYPWKLIYDTKTGDRMLYNLAYDPGEQSNLLATQPAVVRALEEVLIKTRCDLSETWYVEVAGGGQAIDIKLTLPSSPPPGEFEICKFFDSAGNLLESDGLKSDHVETPTAKVFRVQGVEPHGTITLALKVVPETARLAFDFKIDGRSAVDRTFLGEGMAGPGRMPFEQDEAGREAAAGEPKRRPKPPYILIWHSVPADEVDTPVHLAEQTKRSLRALGYIH